MSVAAGVAVMVACGALFAPQAPINRGLAAVTGPLASACANFLVGLGLVLAACLVAGKVGGLGEVPDVPPGHLLGGLLGAAYVLVALLTVGLIGASGVTAATVAGQLAASLALDASGALGLERKPLAALVLLGALAVFLGTYLVVAQPRVVPLSAQAGQRNHAMGGHLLPIAVVFAGGVALGVQHPLNGQLGAEVGDLPASVVNFALGGLALLALLVARGETSGLAGLGRVPWRYRLGGVIGAINATCALALVETIGAGALAAASVTGLAIASLALDRAGVLGLAKRPVTARRLAGAALLVGGTVLVALG